MVGGTLQHVTDIFKVRPSGVETCPLHAIYCQVMIQFMLQFFLVHDCSQLFIEKISGKCGDNMKIMW